MPKKSPKVELPPRKPPAQENASSAALQKTFGISEGTMAFLKVTEIRKLLWVHEDEGMDIRHARLIRALELYESLEPADGAEGMLATQMVGTHDAALECLKRAALPDRTHEQWDMALRRAEKLMTLFNNQWATLNKYRGKGQQKVTVEHVNVAPGGQAIVGTVEHRAPNGKHANPSLAAHEHRDRRDVNTDSARAKAKARKS